MSRLLNRTRFASLLISGMVLLILVTTLSAGVPAYLLTRSRLERQAWSQVSATRQATLSLYQAESQRLVSLTQLLAERPTLQRLLQIGRATDLEIYLEAFRRQSRLDFLQLCDEAGEATLWLGIEIPCLRPNTAGFVVLGGRPALLSAVPIRSEANRLAAGSIVTGIWLDAAFLEQLSASTAVDQSLLSTDYRQLVTTLDAAQTDRTVPGQGSDLSDEQTVSADGQAFYAAYLTLTDPEGEPSLLAEAALPVSGLVATEQRALLVLVASTGLVALLGAVAGTWLIRRLTAPLSQLTAAAERISEGNLVPIPALSGPMEIAALSNSLERSQATMLEALEERSRSRDWLNSLIQSISEGVVTFDTRGRVTFMSQGAGRLSGWSSDEALGRPINSVFPLAAVEDGTFLERIPPAGEKREIEIIARSDRRVVLATTGARLVPPNSDTVQVALVLRDVTEEQALRSLRSFFLANISHEFRTPLSTLNASLELLMDEADELSPAEVRELLKPTHLSLVSLQTLIDNLLESSSMEAGSFAIRPRRVDLNEVIAGALSITRPMLERRSQWVTVSEPAQPVELTADAHRLTQALVNLLNNASKYGPPGQSMDLRVETGDATLRISVADRGPGIPPGEQANLFRQFVRLHAEGREQYGIGLGLYVVKRIAEAHGGAVGVNDRPGGGSIFWMELPFAPEAEAIA
jgi:PAS domain S-box-containing protein